MRLSALRHSLKESVLSIIRHPMVTVASITTIALMLILLGSFLSFSYNARVMVERLGQQPPIEITMELGLTEGQIEAISNSLSKNEDVFEVILFTPEENFQHFKENMEADELFADFPIENIPYTFMVRLNDPERGEAFRAQVSGIPGVRKVTLEQSVMRFLSKAIVWVHYASAVALALLGVVAFFIISNMVRIAVFSRSEEINIMKYVGATNWYIRIPYIIEGALVGLSGALIAAAVIFFAYNRIYQALMINVKSTDILAMVQPGDLFNHLIWIKLLIGVGVGSLGSAISVRKHISV